MDQQIIDNNKLIAEFMEYEKTSKGYYKCPVDNNILFLMPSITTLRFDKDWNWLIPVIDKINKIVDKNNYRYGIGIRYNQIEKAHKAVVEFIKWYNKEMQL